MLDAAHVGLGIAAIGEFSNVMEGKWQGINGRWYDMSSSFWGNQYTGSKLDIVEAARMFRTAGAFGLAADVGLNLLQGTEAIVNGDNLTAEKKALDIFVASAGFFLGPEALAAASVYFAVDQLIGWTNVGAAINTAYQVDQQELTQQLSNMGINEGLKF